MPRLRHINSNLTARSKHQRRASVSSKKVTYRTAQKTRKEGRKKKMLSWIPKRCDVHSISRTPCNSIQNKWERWTRLNESEDKGMQEAGRRRRHDPKTMISARTRNDKKRNGDVAINLRDSPMVNRRGGMVGMEGR
jgi:hypothetical protein